MNTVHTLREYVDALRDAGILVESTVSDELVRSTASPTIHAH